MRLAAVMASLLLVAAGPDEAEIRNLRATRSAETLYVSFQLVDALDEPTLERIRSGLPTEFGYALRLERPRRWWFDNNIRRLRYSAVVTFNAVTEEYLVNYERDGALVDSRVVTSEDELERAMTMVNSLPAFPLDDVDRPRLVLKVRADLGSRHVLLLFPRGIYTPWVRLDLDDLESPTEET